MPRRRNPHARVKGPTWIPSKGQWRIQVFKEGDGKEDSKPTTRWFDDERLAKDTRDEIETGLKRLSKRTIGEAIELYKVHLQEKGTGEISYNETTRRMRAFFPDLSLPVSRVTADRAGIFYKKFRERRMPNGKPISVSYHRCTLINARSFMTWCVDQGWLESNPFTTVKGVGQRNAGKLQLTGDETQKLYDLCMTRAEAGDDPALAVLMALTMALRTSDLTRRIVRDVDMNATVLRVYQGKTDRSNRPRRIPAVLQPVIRKLVKGRTPFEPLFPSRLTGGHHTRRWLEQALPRLCAAAYVPIIVPHALKGMSGTILADLGESADVIANHLSHQKVETTKRHYIAKGALESAQAERAFAVISGGKK